VRDLPDPGDPIRVRQQERVSFGQIARTVFTTYPRRTIVGLSLFVGQAFMYNAVFFSYAVFLTTYYGVSAARAPLYIIPFAVGNFLGPLTLGRLFDTVGRKPMISTTYLMSAALAAILALLLLGNSLTAWSFIAMVCVTFFLASAGASAAYLTVSEIFPMEMRALSIALFYAVGTAIGGISGPLLFGNFINSGNRQLVAIGFLIGAAVMAVGGIAELVLGVKAERRPLEDVAAPLGVIQPSPSRYLPGPSRKLYSPGMPLPLPAAQDEAGAGGPGKRPGLA
jgi:MFS family permease